jgi:hypothetical protein
MIWNDLREIDHYPQHGSIRCRTTNSPLRHFIQRQSRGLHLSLPKRALDEIDETNCKISNSAPVPTLEAAKQSSPKQKG